MNKTVEKKEYVSGWQEKYNTLFVDALAQATVNYPFVIGNHIPEYFSFIDKTDYVETYYSKQSQDIVDKEHGSYFLEKERIGNLIKKFKTIIKKHKYFLKKLASTNLKKLSNKELHDFLGQLFEFIIEMIAYYRSTRHEAETEPIKIIKSILQSKFPKGEIDDILSIITESTKKNLILKEKIDWVKLLMQEDVSDELLQKHIYTYASYFINFFDIKEATNTLKIRFESDLPDTAKLAKEIEDQKTFIRSLTEKQQRIFKQCDNNSDLIDYSQMIQEFGWYRFEIKDIWAGIEIRFMSLFEEVSSRLKTPVYNLYNYYTIQELKDCLITSKPLSYAEINNRKKCMAILVKNGQYTVVSGKTASDIMRIPRDSFKKTNEVKGSVAYQGLVRGHVRKIYPDNMDNIQESNKFQKGEILVTTATQPSMVPIMRLAAAIVTDFGGITSHSAIVARELKIPCVIGTKTGSRSFKDGDLIEVDAVKGIIRKIK